MVRAWIIFSTLVLSVLFKFYKPIGSVVRFPFSEATLNKESWVYFAMEHIIAIAIAACLLIRDNTPTWLLRLFVVILILDLIHYILFFRDEGIGFNLAKALLYGIPLLWKQLKQLKNQV